MAAVTSTVILEPNKFYIKINEEILFQYLELSHFDKIPTTVYPKQWGGWGHQPPAGENLSITL